MPHATTDDGVKLFYEETGSGEPVLFIHEFADDFRGWEPQVRHFGRLYRCITYNARGYPPSDVPEDPSSYSQMRAVGDAIAVLDHLAQHRVVVTVFDGIPQALGDVLRGRKLGSDLLRIGGIIPE